MGIKYNYYNIRILELYVLFSLIKPKYLIYTNVYGHIRLNEYNKIIGGNKM
jgi:hypothetical protein